MRSVKCDDDTKPYDNSNALKLSDRYSKIFCICVFSLLEDIETPQAPTYPQPKYRYSTYFCSRPSSFKILKNGQNFHNLHVLSFLYLAALHVKIGQKISEGRKKSLQAKHKYSICHFFSTEFGLPLLNNFRYDRVTEMVVVASLEMICDKFVHNQIFRKFA